MTLLPHKEISKTLEAETRNFKIITSMCMFKFGYFYPLSGFVRDVFSYYNMSVSQFHLNRWMIVAIFYKYLRLKGQNPIVGLFKYCYSLSNSPEDKKYMAWFYIFYKRRT